MEKDKQGMALPEIAGGEIFKALCENSDLGIFWKDRERRFLGANRKFLDYYGFASEEAIIGKNDEEMGWHMDPEPFKNDEKRVIEEGIATHEVLGHCFSHGHVRAIRASKMPIYENGQIVGLVGYFRDVAADTQPEKKRLLIQETDTVTGLLNARGLMMAAMDFLDSYRARKQDFFGFYISLDNFREILKSEGQAYADEILYAVAKKLDYFAGTEAAIARYSEDDFVLLRAARDGEDLDALSEKLQEIVAEVHSVNGYECHLRAAVGAGRFSEMHDLKKLLTLAAKRTARYRAAQQAQSGTANDSNQ